MTTNREVRAYFHDGYHDLDKLAGARVSRRRAPPTVKQEEEYDDFDKVPQGLDCATPPVKKEEKGDDFDNVPQA